LPEKFDWSLSNLGGALEGLITVLNPNRDIKDKDPEIRAIPLVARMTNEVMGTATQTIEFLAKKLTEGYSRDYNKRVVLGSPIYVSLAE